MQPTALFSALYRMLSSRRCAITVDMATASATGISPMRPYDINELEVWQSGRHEYIYMVYHPCKGIC